MKSTILADLFYKWNINPFYFALLFIFIIPISTFLISFIILNNSFSYSLIYVILIFFIFSVIFYSFFNRNPKREVISDDNSILSPADGKIVYIRKIHHGEIIESVKNENHMQLNELLDIYNNSSENGCGFIIGIEMRIFDEHITRAPITGIKLLQHHVSGKIVTMNNPLFEFINDRETLVLKQNKNINDGVSNIQIAVIQIATFIARSVKSFVSNKTIIKQGEPIGIIRLGSQVDIVIFSTDIKLIINEGDRVYAGITKLAEIV